MFLADFRFPIALMLASTLFFPTADKVLHSALKETLTVILLPAISGILRESEISLPYNIIQPQRMEARTMTFPTSSVTSYEHAVIPVLITMIAKEFI